MLQRPGFALPQPKARARAALEQLGSLARQRRGPTRGFCWATERRLRARSSPRKVAFAALSVSLPDLLGDSLTLVVIERAGDAGSPDAADGLDAGASADAGTLAVDAGRGSTSSGASPEGCDCNSVSSASLVAAVLVVVSWRRRPSRAPQFDCSGTKGVKPS